MVTCKVWALTARTARPERPQQFVEGRASRLCVRRQRAVHLIRRLRSRQGNAVDQDLGLRCVGQARHDLLQRRRLVEVDRHRLGQELVGPLGALDNENRS